MIPRHRRRARPTTRPRPDVILYGIAGLLLGLGIVELSSTGAVRTAAFGFQSTLLGRHLMRVVVGCACCMAAARTNPVTWRRYAKPLLLGSLALLLLPALHRLGLNLETVCPSKNGAFRTISIGTLSIAPAELLKLTLVIWLSHFLASDHIEIRERRAVVIPLIVTAAIASLLLLQPSFSTAVGLSVIVVAMLLLAGAPLKRVGKAVILSGLAVILALPLAGYRNQRIRDHRPPWTCEPGRLSYHARESLIALGAGGLYGRGLGKGHQAYGFLPEMHTDYPLAAVGEETGFLGTAAVSLLFGLLFLRGMRIALRCEDTLQFSLAAGLTISLTLFAWINAGVTTTLLPTTGQTMPFLSYGGVGTVVGLTSIGILDSIHRNSG